MKILILIFIMLTFATTSQADEQSELLKRIEALES